MLMQRKYLSSGILILKEGQFGEKNVDSTFQWFLTIDKVVTNLSYDLASTYRGKLY